MPTVATARYIRGPVKHFKIPASVARSRVLSSFDGGHHLFRSQLILSLRAAIVALMVSHGAAFAANDDHSANEVMPGCRQFGQGAPNFGTPYCVGLVDGLNYLHANSCPPSEVTSGQMVRVVVQYIDRRPARMHENFKKLALEALTAAWPCKR
jgi:hypothetical protein